MARKLNHLVVLALVCACTGKLDIGAPAPAPPAPPALYEPLSAAASAGKVKNLLTGLPPTDAEVAAATADPAALRGLVAQWLQTPQATAKLQSFFAHAFQQSQVVALDFEDQLGPTGEGRIDARMLANLQESFARTAVALVQQGRPFTETLTTRRFMLTPRLMALYAFLDALQITDSGATSDLFQKANAGFSFTLTNKRGAIPLSQTLDPTSANYLVFAAPQLANVYDAACPQDPLVFNGGAGQQSITLSLYQVLTGAAPAFNITTAAGTHRCAPPGFPAAATPLTIADGQSWQMVNVRTPNPGEPTSRVFDILNFRAGNDLVLNTPRVGFFTTPAFLAGWNTNTSNQARVTINQTLIVALGRAISPATATLPPSLSAVDSAHAPQGSDCFACHQSLDPMRQFFRQQYSLYFHPQTAAAQSSLAGSFGFRGVSAPGRTLFDLANQLAAHPDFAEAWTQKLCTYANSAPCLTSDGEFIRIAQSFTASNFDFTKLMIELFSSPLVTYRSQTETAAQGETFPVARRDHLCAALSNRLGLNDVCGLDVNTQVPNALKAVQQIATVLPSDQYSRGAEAPVLASDPSLFFRTGMENICTALAGQLIDAGAASRWTSANPAAATSDFVHSLMGIEKARDATPIDILTSHFQSARTAGLSASDALKSTFVLACLSPSVVGVGQ
jgi:hypothetical protein